MILFVCETKAQILNAIALRYSQYKEEIVDICLCNKIGLLDAIIEHLKAEKIFDKVYTFKTPYRPEQDFISMLKKSFYGFGLIKMIRNALPYLSSDYKKIFISGPDLACIGVYYYLHKQNNNLQLCLYEEGIFEYYIFTYKFNKMRRLYSKWIYGSYYLNECKEIYVYNKNAIISKPATVKAINIPRLSNDNKFKNLVNKIFDYNDSEFDLPQECRYLFIESCFADTYSATIQYNLVQKIYNVVGNKLVVKMHPRSPLDKYQHIGVKCLKTRQSMEMIMMNLALNHISFFSMYSSAIFNMKFMFDLTPNIVMLNNIFDVLSNDSGISSLIEKFKKEYPIEKLYQPKSIIEMNDCIIKISKENN